jgi:hypothetical protein
VAGTVGWLIADPLVQRGIARNAVVAVVVAAVAVLGYLMIAAVMDRATVSALLRRLPLSRLRSARG